MSAAQRQRRHRAKIRREKKAAEVLAIRARNHAKHQDGRWSKWYLEQTEQNRLFWRWRPDWVNMRGRLDELPNADDADELVRQLAEAMMPNHISVADIREAFDRRFGR